MEVKSFKNPVINLVTSVHFFHKTPLQLVAKWKICPKKETCGVTRMLECEFWLHGACCSFGAIEELRLNCTAAHIFGIMLLSTA